MDRGQPSRALVEEGLTAVRRGLAGEPMPRDPLLLAQAALLLQLARLEEDETAAAQATADADAALTAVLEANPLQTRAVEKLRAGAAIPR